VLWILSIDNLVNVFSLSSFTGKIYLHAESLLYLKAALPDIQAICNWLHSAHSSKFRYLKETHNSVDFRDLSLHTVYHKFI
jgi:hypothetical protein